MLGKDQVFGLVFFTPGQVGDGGWIVSPVDGGGGGCSRLFKPLVGMGLS